MPCACTAGRCKTCACGKKNTPCTDACHGKQKNNACFNVSAQTFVDVGLSGHPAEMSVGEIRKACAQREIDPTGSKDEMIERLMQWTSERKELADAPDDSSQSLTLTSDPILIAKKIIELGSRYEQIMCVVGAKLTNTSSKTDLRKEYLNISRVIHPDKLSGKFPNATQAFQGLVSAYERLCQPIMPSFSSSDEKKSGKTKKIMRSNEGCVRTKVFCPKCDTEWGLAISGVENCAYNFLMTGLKTYSCCLCLFEFGCMTAKHVCPYCRKPFLYDPSDFHKKIKCNNGNGCTKEFGFMQYPVSERRENELREELRQEQEIRMKKNNNKQGRAERANKRGIVSEPTKKEKEKAFKMELSDVCPRCGEFFEDGETAREHLKQCTDKKKHAMYQERLEKETTVKEKKKVLEEKQEDVQNYASWEFLGSSTENLWLLTDKHLQSECRKRQLNDEGTKSTLISRLAKDSGSRRLTDNSGGGARVGKGNELPSNLYALTVEQLKGVCAAHNIKCDEDSASKKDLINLIEMCRLDPVQKELLRIEGGSGPAAQALSYDSHYDDFEIDEEDDEVIVAKPKKRSKTIQKETKKVKPTNKKAESDDDAPLSK